MNQKELAKKIIELKNADLKLRDKLIEEGRLGDGYDQEMAKLHTKNADILDSIMSEIDYPTIGKVGKEANDAAWLVIQHSIGNPDFMIKCLKLLAEAVEHKEADKIHLAYLSDRIAVFQGKNQLYGTQFDWDDNGEMNPYKFDDLEKVNARRKAIGLNSIEEQIQVMRQRTKVENENPPQNIQERKIEFDKWRKSVGWI